MTLYSKINVWANPENEKEGAFFDQTTDAFFDAAKQKNVLDYIATFDSDKAEVETEYTSLKGKLKTPCVVVLYRAKETDKFKVAILKGVGNVAAWKNKFIEIFEGTPVAQDKEQDGGDQQNDNESGTAEDGENGTGDGNGWGFGRPCIPFIDDLFNDLGLNSLKKYVFGAGAVYFGYKALNTEQKTAQLTNGAIAAAAAFLAMNTKNDCSSKKKSQ